MSSKSSQEAMVAQVTSSNTSCRGYMIRCGSMAVQFSSDAGHFEDVVDIQGGAPAGVADILASRNPDRVVGERAQAGDDVGVLANARSVLGESGVAHVVAAVLDAPVTPDPFVPALGRLAGSRGSEETQKTVSSVCAQSPVAGLRLQTVRSKRSTVLIRFSQGVWRNHALAGNTVNSRVPSGCGRRSGSCPSRLAFVLRFPGQACGAGSVGCP